jgi:hypothetical protein
MWQELVVALVVLVAAAYVGARYLPAAWRIRVVNRLSRGGTDSLLVRWLDTADSCGGGCKTCNTCETPEEMVPGEGSKHRIIKIHRK